MLVYSDTKNNYRYPSKDLEFEVLNELNSTEPRSDENCMFHTRFLFEFDERTLEEQKEILEKNKNLLVRATFSGSKSIHMIVEFPESWERFCKDWYKNIWRWLEHNYFNGADNKCANPSRLTRAPGSIRKDTGAIQELLLDTQENYIVNDKSIAERLLEAKERWKMNLVLEEQDRQRRAIASKFLSGNNHDGMCKTYTTVKRYLDTPFPRVRGNGNSSTWLFAAVCTCLKYKDNVSLNEVIEKAKREKWTDKELSRTIESAKSKIN